MKSLHALAVVAVFNPCLVSMAAERLESFSWVVGAIPIVKLNTCRGEIRVEPSDSGRVELLMNATTKGSESSSWLKNIQIKVTPIGAGLVISVINTSAGVEFGLGEIPELSLQLTLRAPQVSSLDIQAHQGSIEVGNDFEGRMRVRLDGGNVFIGRTKGSVLAYTGSGTISVARTTGNLTATTRKGNIFVGTVFGWAELRADSGDIEISNTLGGIDAVAQAGSVKVGVESSLERDSRVEANAGNIELSLNPASGMELQAQARRGRVHSEIPFELSEKRVEGGRIHGRLNGGGVLLALSTRGGNVKIKSAYEPTVVF
jgi:DUF4097 and DUF4098 domain-containing protein YvlB